MALSVEGFVTPEQQFGGIYKAANTIERKNEKAAELQRQQAGKKAASAQFLTNYLNPKDNLTGTNYDPQIVAGFDKLLQNGMKLANEGADTNMILMALSPEVAKLNEYSTKAKLVNERLKQQLAQIPKNAGYDMGKLEQETRKAAFMNEDGSLKDITTIDPNIDFLTETVRKYPDRVTTDAGIDEFARTAQKFSNTQTVKRINPKGGYEYRKSKVTSPSWMTVDDEGELVPKYEVALEGGKPHTFDFTTGEGTTKSAAIRLMDEQEFNSIMRGNPGVADYIKGQVQMANPQLDWNSPQAKNAARAILYDELKRRRPGGMEDVEEVKDTPAPRVSVRVNNSTSKEPVKIDLREYKDVDGGKDVTDLFRGVKVTGLPTGSSLLAESVTYNPTTQQVTYKEYTDSKDAKPKTVSLTKFFQDIKTLNPQIDMKFLEGLRNPITGAAPQQTTTPQPAKKEILRKDIAAKAQAAGYSVKEYEALLKKNGVTIKD